MKKLLLITTMILSVTACKKKDEVANQAPVVKASSQDLANRLMSDRTDWTASLPAHIDTILTCANSGNFQAKYIFKASSTLVLIKGEDDKVYACSMAASTPDYQEISVKIPAKAARFYPGELPKPDSCLNNTRILDKSGHTAGWLSKITC